jgi:hypothetical protein
MKFKCSALGFILAVVLCTTNVDAAQHNWDNNLPGGATYSWFNGANWLGTPGGVPVNGNTVDLEVDNTSRTYDIENGGAGVALSSSTIDIGRGTYVDGNGVGNTDPLNANEGIVGGTIRFNGAGGASPTINVPVTASIVSSNRHGAVFNREITIDQLLARSGHQDHWQINVSPTKVIDYVDLDENRNADGDSIDGNVAFNADTSVTLLDHTWSRLIVGAGATLTVDTLKHWDYANNLAPNNNINPMTLNGDLVVTTFEVYDIGLDSSTFLAPGTYYGPNGSGPGTQVDFITNGSGTLTVVPEPASMALLGLGMLGLCFIRRRY